MGSTPHPIHTDPGVRHVDVRVYFPADEYTQEDCVDKVADALGNAPELAAMQAAYELKNDGFGRLLPDERGPLA
jgi:hypothetical protein